MKKPVSEVDPKPCDVIQSSNDSYLMIMLRSISLEITISKTMRGVFEIRFLKNAKEEIFVGWL